MSLGYENGRLSESFQACPYSVISALHSQSGTFIHLSATSIECRVGLDSMTLWLSFGSDELGLVLPLVCVSHHSPATYWISQSLSLRYGNGRLSVSYQAYPSSVTSALHS